MVSRASGEKSSRVFANNLALMAADVTTPSMENPEKGLDEWTTSGKPMNRAVTLKET